MLKIWVQQAPFSWYFAIGWDLNPDGAKLHLASKYGTDVFGEGGEHETLVTDRPLFEKKIKIEKADTIWDERTNGGYLLVKKAKSILK